ncbi:MAG: DUF402 domain-containing protein [Ardenticatenales bacterium]|nr:DUF402 domain-containing protein [Ardenticatenales bacterium]
MKTITILSTKYDNSLHWRYEAHLLEETEWGWLTFHPRHQPVTSHKGTWLNNHPLLRWHWREQWWDALLLFDDHGQWLEWYCNVITPPRLENGVLRYQDLDLDVIWHREHGVRIADADEFERHAVQMAYPQTLIQQARESAQEVRGLMQHGGWRFGEDPSTLRLEQELARWQPLLL